MDVKIPLRRSLKRTISALSIKDDVVEKKLRTSYDDAVPIKLQTVEQDLVDVEAETGFLKRAMDIDCEKSLNFSISKIDEIEEIIAKSWDTVNAEQCKLNGRRERIMMGKMEIIESPKNPAKPTTLSECNDRQTYLDQMRNKIHEREKKIKSLKKKTSKLSFNVADYRPMEINYNDNHESLCDHLEFFIHRVLH